MIPPHSSSDYGDRRCAGSFAGAPRRLHSAGLLGPLRRRRRSSSSFFMISAKKMWEIFAKKHKNKNHAEVPRPHPQKNTTNTTRMAKRPADAASASAEHEDDTPIEPPDPPDHAPHLQRRGSQRDGRRIEALRVLLLRAGDVERNPGMDGSTPPPRRSWLERARGWVDPTGGWMEDPTTLLAKLSGWVDPTGAWMGNPTTPTATPTPHKAAADDAAAATSDDNTPRHDAHDAELLATPPPRIAATPKVLRCALAPDSAAELALVVASLAPPPPRPAPPACDFAANLRENNRARFGHDDDSDVDDGSEDTGAGSDDEPDVVTPVPTGCAPVDAAATIAHAMTLYMNAGGSLANAIGQGRSRRALGLLDLLHRDLVGLQAPSSQHARKRFKVQLSVSVLLLAHSARRVRGLVVKSGALQERRFADFFALHTEAARHLAARRARRAAAAERDPDTSDVDNSEADDASDDAWLQEVDEECHLLPETPGWMSRALAGASASHATDRREMRTRSQLATQLATQDATRNAPDHVWAITTTLPTPLPAPSDDESARLDLAAYLLGKGPFETTTAQGEGHAPRVQGCSDLLCAPSPAARLAHDVQLGNGEALTSDDAMTASDAPTAAHDDNGRSDGSGAKPTFSGGTNAGTTGAGTN